MTGNEPAPKNSGVEKKLTLRPSPSDHLKERAGTHLRGDVGISGSERGSDTDWSSGGWPISTGRGDRSCSDRCSGFAVLDDLAIGLKGDSSCRRGRDRDGVSNAEGESRGGKGNDGGGRSCRNSDGGD